MSAAVTTTYSVDTSAMIDGLERYYPEDSFPALWSRLDELIAAGRWLFSEEVWEEIQSKDAVVKAWCESRKDAMLILIDSEVAQAVQKILTSYPRLVMTMKNRNRADPFVIAVGQLRRAVVVTGEGPDGTPDRPKIPFICGQLGIPCIRFLEVIRREGWSF